jgi:hypothetical protein
MAEPLPNEDQDPATGFQADRTGAGVMAALAKADSALQPLITSYRETGATLTPVAGVLTIPLDGRVYTVTLTANVTSVLTTAPTAPECGSAVVYINQDATGNRAFPFPATWRWPGKAVTAITLTANAQSELLLNSTPAGTIIARVTPNIGVVA